MQFRELYRTIMTKNNKKLCLTNYLLIEFSHNISFITCPKYLLNVIRLLSKLDENVFQSMVNTNKATDHQVHPPQESSTSAMSDVSFIYCEKSNF